MSNKKSKKRRGISFEIEFFERLLLEKPDYTEAMIALAESYTQAGDYEKGLELDRKICGYRPQDAVAHYNLACSCALTGKLDEAFGSLRVAINSGYKDFRHLDTDPDLASLRQDDRYRSLIIEVLKQRKCAVKESL